MKRERAKVCVSVCKCLIQMEMDSERECMGVRMWVCVCGEIEGDWDVQQNKILEFFVYVEEAKIGAFFVLTKKTLQIFHPVILFHHK